MATEYKDQQLRKPIVITDVLNGESIVAVQPVFLLTEGDFIRLQGGPPQTATVATVIFSGVVGYAIALGPKILATVSGGQNQLTNGEIATVVIGAIVSLLFYGIGYLLPNDRKKMLSRIKIHFQMKPASTHIVGGAK